MPVQCFEKNHVNIQVLRMIDIDNKNGLKFGKKLKCTFGTSRCEYSTDYASINESNSCVWNNSANIKLQSRDEPLKFKIKSKRSKVCYAILNLHEITQETDDNLLTLSCRPMSEMLTKIPLKKSNSLGSVSFDSKYGSPAKLSMRLLIKAVGDVDYFSLPSKNPSKIRDLIQKSPMLNRVSLQLLYSPASQHETPDKFDLSSVSSIASSSMSRIPLQSSLSAPHKLTNNSFCKKLDFDRPDDLNSSSVVSNNNTKELKTLPQEQSKEFEMAVETVCCSSCCESSDFIEEIEKLSTRSSSNSLKSNKRPHACENDQFDRQASKIQAQIEKIRAENATLQDITQKLNDKLIFYLNELTEKDREVRQCGQNIH